MNTLTWQAIEDNGGGLHLAVFNDSGCIYLHSGFEYTPGDWAACINALKTGENPIDAGWEGCADDPQGEYDNIMSYKYGWEIVADEEGIYPDKMGSAAKKEFGIEG